MLQKWGCFVVVAIEKKSLFHNFRAEKSGAQPTERGKISRNQTILADPTIRAKSHKAQYGTWLKAHERRCAFHRHIG
jgi:hypothetical protein